MADASQMSAPARLQPVRYGISQGAASRMRQQTMPLAGPAGLPVLGGTHHCHGIQDAPLDAAMNARAGIWLGGVSRGPAHHLAQRHHGRAPSVGRGGSQRAAFRDLRRHGRDGAVMGGSTRIRMRRGRLGHVYLPFHGPVIGRRVSPLPPGQDPGPTASIRYRLSQPRRGTTSVTNAGDHDDLAAVHRLLR